MKTTLYQVAAEYRDIALQLAETDLDEQTIADTLEAEAWPIEEKARSISAIILQLEAEAEMIKSAETRIAARRKAVELRAQWLHDYLMVNMKLCAITQIKAIDGTFSATLYPDRDASVQIEDADKIPREYMREIPARLEADKTLIKKAIDNGADVPGAVIVRKDRLTIK